MIVVDEGPEWLLVTQPDHARFAADLLALWRRDGLPEHPRRDELLLAIREHDNGWREADAAPRVDAATGRPHDLMTLPDGLRREIWDRGSRRLSAERPYAAWLVTRHVAGLARGRAGTPEWDAFLAEIDERLADLAERTGLPAAELEQDYRFLDLGDQLSLAVCNRWPEAVTRVGVTGRYEDGTLRLEPFPLAGVTGFDLDFRRIPARRYRGDADLAGELAAAAWQRQRIRVTPAAA